MSTKIERILVTGAAGQIGSELTMALRKKYGNDNVIATDLRKPIGNPVIDGGCFETLDVLNAKAIDDAIDTHKIDTVVHLAAILSAVGEKNPSLAWNVNINGMINVLEVAREKKLSQVMIPSSIAVFGAGTPLENTPQETVLKPATMYGVTKVAGELVCDYYVAKYGLDIRGLRYPGIISAETLPGGGTTDYAVAIYYDAIKYGSYTCFVNEDTRLPMMYMPDCIKATMDLMAAPFEKLKNHADFNVGAMSFTVGELAAEIKKHISTFNCIYDPDYRQAIADSWPNSVDDIAAREQWQWKPYFDLASMTTDMLKILGKKHAKGKLQ